MIRAYNISGASETTAIKVSETIAPAVQTIRGFGRSNVGALSILEVDMGRLLNDGHKKCKECGQVYPRTEFWKRGDNRGDGRILLCRTCARERKRYLQRQRGTQKTPVDKKRQKPDPVKQKAKGQLCNAVQRGKIIKPSRCEGCGQFRKKRSLAGHHSDYSKPLEVKWLCSYCHAEAHLDRPSQDPLLLGLVPLNIRGRTPTMGRDMHVCPAKRDLLSTKGEGER